MVTGGRHVLRRPRWWLPRLFIVNGPGECDFGWPGNGSHNRIIDERQGHSPKGSAIPLSRRGNPVSLRRRCSRDHEARAVHATASCCAVQVVRSVMQNGNRQLCVSSVPGAIAQAFSKASVDERRTCCRNRRQTEWKNLRCLAASQSATARTYATVPRSYVLQPQHRHRGRVCVVGGDRFRPAFYFRLPYFLMCADHGCWAFWKWCPWMRCRLSALSMAMELRAGRPRRSATTKRLNG